MAKRETSKIDQINSFLIGGSALVGVGFGFLNDELVAGAVLGVGIGLLVAAAVRSFGK